MNDTTKTYLPPTPNEVFSAVMPTMADVDYFFEQGVAVFLHDEANAKSLLAGQQLKIPITRILYKNYGDEILNRFTEQGWAAKWDWDYPNIADDDRLVSKSLLIGFVRKSHEQISEALGVAE